MISLDSTTDYYCGRKTLIKKVPTGLKSLLITLLIYFCFYFIVSQTPGDEMENRIIAAATFVSMTLFINFPVCWWIVHQIIKKNIKANK